MYDAPGGTPLLRLSWNGLDPNYIATFAMDAQVGVGESGVCPTENGGCTKAQSGVGFSPVMDGRAGRVDDQP